MDRNSIITLPNLKLRQPSKKVGVITDDIKKIVLSMQEATLDWEDNRDHEVGVALAAVQIDKNLKIVIVRNDFDNKQDRSFQTFINPKITKYYGDVTEDFEGCLSIKDIYGKVPRHEKIKVSATDINGNKFSLNATGFLARVLQHEIDHTKGKVFIDHIKNKKNAFYKLEQDGKLKKLDYKKDIEDNSSLWGN